MPWIYFLLFYFIAVQGRIISDNSFNGVEIDASKSFAPPLQMVVSPEEAIENAAEPAHVVERTIGPVANNHYSASVSSSAVPLACGEMSSCGFFRFNYGMIKGKQVAVSSLRMQYITPAIGCPQVIFRCSGIGAVEIIANADSDAQVTIGFDHNRFGETNVTTTLTCLENGWGNSTFQLGRKQFGYAVCYADDDVPPPAPKIPYPTPATIPKYCAAPCRPAVIGTNERNYFQRFTCNQRHKYYTGIDGCQHLLIACTGYGVVSLWAYSGKEMKYHDQEKGTNDSLTTIRRQFTCKNGGWSGWEPDVNFFACLVEKEIKNPPSCSGEATTVGLTSTASSTQSSIPSKATTVFGDECEATEMTEQPATTEATSNATSAPEPKTTTTSTTTEPSVDC